VSAAPVVQLLVGVGYAADITSLLSIKLPVSVTRGRSDEFSDVQPSVMTLTLDISTTTPPTALVVGAPIRLRATVNGVTTNRFTGVVESTQVTWPKGAEAACVVSVTAVDSLAALSRRRLSGVLTQAVTTLAPDIYYPLDEPEGATSCGDRTGHGWPTLALAQRGTGGTFTLGGGTGPATEPSTSATFERASATAGPYLTASYTAEQLRLFSTTFAFVVSSSTVAAQSWIRLRRPDIESSDGTPLLEIGCTAAGYLQIKSAYRAGFTAAGTVNICDGLPHLILVVCNESPGGFGIAGAFNVMAGVDSDTLSLTANDTSSSDRVPSIFRIDLGGSASTGSNMASASISRLMLWGRELSAGERSSLVAAATTGFITDSTNGRIQRIATWAGITNLALETGSVTSVAHQDTTGLSPIAAMQAVAATERGLVFINGSGQLVFHARSHRNAPTWTALVDANALNEDVTFTTDTQALINKATVSRPAGAAQTFQDTASIALYDEYATDAELLFTNDTDAYDAAAWLVNTHGTPAPRISTVTLDLLTQTAAITQQLQALELGSLIGITGLPSQAPSGGLSLFVEGWSESISVDAWEMVLNTSPLDSALVLDSDWYDQLDYWRLG
jgi:hypothetical protein